jgi:hypothetical protein
MSQRGLSTEHGCYQRVILPLFDAPTATARSLECEASPASSRQPLAPSERKRRGLKRAVARSPFLADALRLVPHVLTPGEVLLGEDVRVRLEGRGVEPRSPRAWGALISTLVKRGILSETGAWRPMRRNRGGSRRTPEYRVGSVRS